MRQKHANQCYLSIFSIIATLLLAVNSHSADRNGKFSIVGPGFDDCSTFTRNLDRAKETDNWIGWNKFRFYTLGYLTGVNEFLPDTYNIKGDKILTDGTFEIMDMIDAYCRDHPKDIYFLALRHVVKKLYNSREKESPNN